MRHTKNALARLDMYRKVPIDLLEGSKSGSVISLMALLIMTTLVVLETKAYFTSTLVTDLALDRSSESKIQVNFNITMMDLPCEFATIDVVSFLGKQQNVTKQVDKKALDAQGVKNDYVHKNPMQHDITLSDPKVTESVEELHENGEHAIPVDEEELEWANNEYEFVFIDYYANWCSHCRIFAPTWERFAEIMDEVAETKVEEEHGENHGFSEEEYEKAKSVALPAFIGKVDCVDYRDLCMRHGVQGYPSIRLFVRGKLYSEYWGDRTILGLMQFLKMAEEQASGENKMSEIEEWTSRAMNVSDSERKWAHNIERRRHHKNLAWDASKHPGCQISGELYLDRTPGNFYIQARSPNHDLNPSTTNVSHMVHFLSFSNHYNSKDQKMKAMFGNLFVLFNPKFPNLLHPINGNVYVADELHQAHHHYLKLVSTNLESYQVVANSQLSYYTESAVPEAKFQLDLSPIQVTYRRKYRTWYEFVTSLMAILGGTFTVVGMLDSAIKILSARPMNQKARPPKYQPR